MALNLINTVQAINSDVQAINDLRELIVNQAFYDDANLIFRLQPGIKGKKDVVALDSREYVTTKKKGCNLTTYSSFELSGIKQQWDPRVCEVFIGICESEFEDSFLQWGLANGVARYDLNESTFVDFIKSTVSEAIRADFMRIALFGDENIAAQDILGDADKAEFYDLIGKGLIPTLQYFKSLTNLGLDAQFTDIDANNAATRVEQMNLGSTAALDLFDAMREGVYYPVDQFITSDSLLRNYTKYMTRGLSPLESSKTQIINGVQNLAYDGMVIQSSMFHDMVRERDFTKTVNGAPVTHLPHFAVLGEKNNFVIGIDDEASLSDLKLEYIGGKERMFYISASYLMDFKIPNPKRIKAAL